jgi:hypothetical protein
VRLDKAVAGCNFTGFAVDGNQCVPFMILHLLFANYMSIFCSLDHEQFLYLKCVLVCFEAKTSFRINLGKSELVPIGKYFQCSKSGSYFWVLSGGTPYQILAALGLNLLRNGI